jgi:squalene synthase HpnC
MKISTTQSAFESQLAIYGPADCNVRPTLADAKRYCRWLACGHYENFSVASFLLPTLLREPFYAIYSYCRWADDLGDETGSTERATKLLDWWENELECCFDDARDGTEQSTHPVYVALCDVLKRYPLPKQPFADLLKAFRQDQRKHTYATMDELLNYCEYSANPVGRIVLYLAAAVWKTREPNADELRWSDSICTGLQLANHWQDVSRDRKIGRCYIPEASMKQYGIERDGDWNNKRFREMMKELVKEATEKLEFGEPLIASIPKKVRHSIALFVEGGKSILNEIRKANYNVSNKRPKVSALRKIWILMRVYWRRW